MTVTIDLPPELETQMRGEAAKEGLDTSAFVANAVKERLRRSREAQMPPTEAQLLEIINVHWSPQMQKRFHNLVARRRANKLAAEELSHLTAMTDLSEQQAAERVRAVGELARRRGMSFEALWQQLGLPS